MRGTISKSGQPELDKNREFKFSTSKQASMHAHINISVHVSADDITNYLNSSAVINYNQEL